jgi:hypothetical protein
MAYIGNEPTSAAFVTDLFSGNGSTVAFTMTVSPANTASVLIAISGVVQSPDTYSISGTTLTFSAAPPAGTGNISVRYLGIPATNVTTTAYRTVTEFTATAGQTTFSVPSYTVGYIDVYRNGVRLGTADYTATNGTSVVLVNAATVGDLVTTESFYVSSVLNAIPATGGAINTIYLDAGNANGTGALLTPSGTTGQRPASPIVGMQRWNTTIGGMEVYIGNNNWQTVASTAYTVDYLVVAGGGGGGGELAGGGGAGGMLTGSAVAVSPGTSYTITVGAGGAGGNGARDTDAAKGKDGSLASFLTFAAIGGGGGGIYTTSGGGRSIGNAGGSGGGGGGSGGGSTAGGTGTVGQGNAGGAGYPSSSYPGGGGGGAGGVGGNYKNTADGGNGGPGATSSITGTITYYAGGGGGSSYLGVSSTGGLGGGGAGNPGAGSNGGANTGGGGGGGGYVGAPSTGGNGGSGVVIIRYLGSAARASGGTITITGGYVIHTFTSSGTFIA